MPDIFNVFAMLVFAHLIGDFALQNEYMAKAKNPNIKVVDSPWYVVMFAHAGIHAGLTGFITGSLIIALFELVAHYVIDYYRCLKRFSYLTDQILHIVCKFIYVIILYSIGMVSF